MKFNTIKNIAKKIKNINIDNIEQIQNEDGDDFYSVWKIAEKNNIYILKKSNENEINNYNLLTDINIPKFYGYLKYYNKFYILIEYLEGADLMDGNLSKCLKALDTIIDINKKYLNKEINLSDSFDKELIRINKRIEYLNDEKLENKYKEFIAIYKKTIKTACHNDLLPFNMIVSNGKAYLIDLEHVGYLPYLLMLVRIIAHYKEEKGYLFYLEEDAKEKLIKYYYDNFVVQLNKSYEEYCYELDLFMFFEYTEWVYVYNKYKLKKDDRYNYYLNKCYEVINKSN